MLMTKSDIRRGLIGHWGYAGNGSVSTSDSWYDRSGNGNTTTLYNDTYIDSEGAHFDGTGDYASIDSTNLSNYSTGSNLSFSAWVYFETASTYASIIHIGKSGLMSSKNQRIGIPNHNSNNIYTYSGQSFSTGSWTHIAGTRTIENSFQYFLNGENVGTSSTSDTGYPTTYLIGGGYSAFNGIIDDARIYNRILPAAEIKQMYNQGKWRAQ